MPQISRKSCRKKTGRKIENFPQQVKQSPYYLCTYTIKDCINTVLDFLNKRNIKFFLQNFITK